MKYNWSVSAAHLYIFGWSQIKFSEVETEELRFGEQCEILYKNLIMLQQDNPLDNTYSIIRV